MKVIYMLVANVREGDPQSPTDFVCRNWDIMSFDDYPKPAEMKSALEAAHFVGNDKVVRYLKVEKRYMCEE